MHTPDTHYVTTDDGVYIAYQVAGDGPIDISMSLDSDLSNVDLIWDYSRFAPYLERLCEFSRLILHDRRGVGVSSRNVPVANLETRVTDLMTVLDQVGSDRPILFGGPEPGMMHVVFAATHPNRVGGLVWWNASARVAWAPDYPWGLGPDVFARTAEGHEQWGTDAFAHMIEDLNGERWDERSLDAYRRINRNTAAPDVALELNRIWWETDVRGVLRSVQAPTLLTYSDERWLEEVRHVASLMPRATVERVPFDVRESAEVFATVIRTFFGVERPTTELDTFLSTVLFTDIVGSTATQATVGDRAWRELVQRHHEVVRGTLERWDGAENDTAGDGFYATFDGPARAIRCAQELVERVRGLGIEVRAGVHTGECRMIDGKVGGIAASIGARVAAIAGSSEVLVSQTVKDLVAGSGLSFEDAGEHELKGVPDTWRLYRVVG